MSKYHEIIHLNAFEQKVLDKSEFASLEKDELHIQFKKHNSKAREQAQKSLENIRMAGEVLICLKAKTVHGNWIYMLKKELRIDRRTASNYMRIALKWETVSHLPSVKGVLQFLREAEETSAPEQTTNEVHTTQRPTRPSASAVTVDAEIIESNPAPVSSSARIVQDENPDDEPPCVVVDGRNEIKEDQEPTLEKLKSTWMAATFATRKEFLSWAEKMALEGGSRP